MENLTKSMISLPLAAFFFSVKQASTLLNLQSSGQPVQETADALNASTEATEDYEAAIQAVGANLGQLPLGIFLLVDSMQREATRTTFSLFAPSAWNPNSNAIQDLMKQTTETLRNPNPLQAGGLTVQELQNKMAVFRLVLQIPSRLALPA